MSIMHCSLLSLGCAFGFTPPGDQKSLTALRALKIGQRRLRPEVRSKLLSLSSARTDNTFLPEAWRCVFLDSATSGNCRVVTVAAKTSSEHPDTVEAFSSSKVESVSALTVIPQNKLMIDSDRVLELAREMSKLKGVKSAQYKLGQSQKTSQEPFWQVDFFDEGPQAVASFRVGAKAGTIELVSNGQK